MKRFSVFLFSALILFSLSLSGQRAWDFSKDSILERLRKDVFALSAEEMQGRESGTEGERLAAAYVKKRMQEIGLEPMFEGSFFQEVPFYGELKPGPNNHIIIGRDQFKYGDDFYVLPQSGNTSISARVVYAGFGLEGVEGHEGYQDLKRINGKIVMLEYFLPEGLEGRLGMTFNETLAYRIELAVKKGASGIIFINSDSGATEPVISLRRDVPRENIPIVFAKSAVAEQIMKRPRREVTLATQLDRQSLTGLNVAGYWNNNASTTVIIGGHFDHLGFGGAGSRSPGVRELHPGADDNASGTAGLLEIARYLVNSNLTGNNYIFIAFGVEEKGLIGSRYFAGSDAYPMRNVNYMFNLDMIGRLADNNLALIGTGSSPSWDAAIDQVAPEHFNIRRSPGGLGGSDHASFYMKGIPVLFLFTGIHDDYHRPGDTPDKLNFVGMYEILEIAHDLIEVLDASDRLAFTQTQAVDSRRRRADGVTLGVMPDHVHADGGLKIQAVIKDRPAYRAGLLAGDIIVRINDDAVNEIHSYMRALGNLRPGTVAIVTVQRGDQEITFSIQL